MVLLVLFVLHRFQYPSSVPTGRSRRGRTTDGKPEVPIGFRVRLGSAEEESDSMEEPLRKKRARASAPPMKPFDQIKQSELIKQPELIKSSSELEDRELTKERKKSKLNNHPSSSNSSFIPSNNPLSSNPLPINLSSGDDTFITPGTYVIHLSAPGSSRGSYDTLRSCHVTSMMGGLRTSSSAVSDTLSPVDSDSEETARNFLNAIRHRSVSSSTV